MIEDEKTIITITRGINSESGKQVTTANFHSDSIDGGIGSVHIAYASVVMIETFCNAVKESQGVSEADQCMASIMDVIQKVLTNPDTKMTYKPNEDK